jgi:hypothetical protein
LGEGGSRDGKRTHTLSDDAFSAADAADDDDFAALDALDALDNDNQDDLGDGAGASADDRDRSSNGRKKAWSDIAELSPEYSGFPAEATRVMAPRPTDLDQSQGFRDTVVAPAPQVGWGDREETSTQLWNGLRRPLPPARDLPPLHELNGLSDLPPLDFTNDPRGPARPSRLPSEARPRLPSPSVPPSGDLRASRVPQEARGSRVPEDARASHAARAQTLRSALRSSRPPAVNLPHPPRPASTTTVQGLSPIALPVTAETASALADGASVTLDELQEQLLASIERARLQESRAYEAEQRALRAETKLQQVSSSGALASVGAGPSGQHAHAQSQQDVAALRDALQSAQNRIRRSEDQAEDAERRVSASEDLVRMARLRLAEASVPAADGPVPKPNTFSLGFLITGLAVCLVSSGIGVYFGFVSPLKQQVQTQEQRFKLDAEERERAVAALKSKVETERQSLEVEAQQLRAKLEASRAVNGVALPGDASAEGDKAGRTASKRSAALAADPDSPTRSARAIIGRYRHAKAVEAREREADSADESKDDE